MIKQCMLLMAISLMLGSCSHHGVLMKPPINQPSSDASIKLAEAASSISESMYEIAKVEKVIYPEHKGNSKNIPNTYALQTRASVDWASPVEELTKKIAHAAHYRFRVLGQEPAIPVLVSLSVKDQNLADILRNIDYQAGSKAMLRVYPKTQVVELRYAKIYS
ncbi:MAG TPA: hypothetical protein DCG13_03795 [Legionellales bacterium]|nr:hypothetical protein [Legionellales bacterium]